MRVQFLKRAKNILLLIYICLNVQLKILEWFWISDLENNDSESRFFTILVSESLALLTLFQIYLSFKATQFTAQIQQMTTYVKLFFYLVVWTVSLFSVTRSVFTLIRIQKWSLASLINQSLL